MPPWATYPIRRRTPAGSARRSQPATSASPAVGVSSVVSMRRVVVLPAPLGPRKPAISPRRTARSTPRTASTTRPRVRKLRASPRAEIISCPPAPPARSSGAAVRDENVIRVRLPAGRARVVSNGPGVEGTGRNRLRSRGRRARCRNPALFRSHPDRPGSGICNSSIPAPPPTTSTCCCGGTGRWTPARCGPRWPGWSSGTSRCGRRSPTAGTGRRRPCTTHPAPCRWPRTTCPGCRRTSAPPRCGSCRTGTRGSRST